MDRRWRWILAAGVVVATIASAVAFGVAGVGAYAGLLAVAVTAAKTLLVQSHRRSRSRETSPAGAFIARRRVVKSSAIVLWSAAVLLLAYAGIREYRRTSQVSVRGVVRDAAGRPVPNANVSLSGHPTREETDTAGRFEFENVDRKRAAEITASSEGYESEPVTWDPTKDGSRPAEIRLPTDPPFRVTHMVLRGFAVDLFLAGDDDTYIAQNDVWRHAKKLARQFSMDAGNPTVKRITSGREETWYDGALANIDTVFAGSTGMPSLDGDFGPLQRVMTEKDLPRVAQEHGWHVFAAPLAEERNLGLRRFAMRKDLDQFRDEPYARFMLNVTRESFPPAFGIFTFTTPLIGCEFGGPTATLVLPRAVLHVAVLENISEKPLAIKSFLVRENSNHALRDMTAEEKQMSEAVARSAQLVPMEVTPGEKVAIPLAMLLVHDEEEIEEFGGPSTDAASDADTVAQTFSIPASVARSLHPPRNNAMSSELRYVYGPSVDIERVELREASYPFRRQSTISTLLKGVAEIGSCPFVMTHSTRGWQTEGVILAGRDEPGKIGSDAMPLRQFDGMIVIEEREPETSYIERAVVRAQWRDGMTLVLHPRCDRPCFPSILRRGERLKLRFDMPRRAGATFHLEVRGYFVVEQRK